METKGIDLTKCKNCRAWVREKDSNGDETEMTGRLDVYRDGCVHLTAEDETDDICLMYDGEVNENIMDFEIIPRDPETYMDWQVGDIVCEGEHRNVYYEVIFRSGELVIFKGLNGWANNPMTCSEAFTRFGRRLVLTSIERQIIEEKKRYEPQDGDICYAISVTGYNDVFICKTGDRKTEYYASTVSDSGGAVMSDEHIEVLRPATEEEKQQLFDTMAKRGKRWNAEKKVVEDIPKPYEFKKGEPVLVRCVDDGEWRLRSFIRYNGEIKFPYIATEGIFEDNYAFCIPYNERTMHLLGTSEDYREE